MNPEDPSIITPTTEPQPSGVPPRDTMFQPVAPPGPLPNTASPAYVQPAPSVASSMNMPPRKRSKKPLLIGIGIAVALLLIITVIIVVTAGQPKTVEAPQTSSEPQGPQPAQAIDVEQASNSIGQDITSHDNNKDFPPDQLDDKSLGL